jgi:hypothetical protein
VSFLVIFGPEKISYQPGGEIQSIGLAIASFRNVQKIAGLMEFDGEFRMS